MTLAAHAVHDLEALAPALGHGQHRLWRILEVGVHHDHRPARGKIQARRDRHLVAKVPRQLEQLEPRVALVQIEHQRVAVVSTAVVDEDDLGVSVEVLEQPRQPLIELG